jgi:dTDP-4-amino-4,6-dideoxygalactose transaminase
MNIPLVRPAPPRLSQHIAELEALEASGIFSNFGPVNTRFEDEMMERFFGGQGACMTVCNATIGLMLAIRDAVGDPALGEGGDRKYALMPSFTFAAAAHAALWCGLTPLLCDVDTASWSADPKAESEMLAKYAGKIAVVIPYSTFGYPIDLNRYTRISTQLGVPVVVDGAASLGTADAEGRGFGVGFAGSVVYSMHATKSFAVGEAGVIYSADAERIARLRTMNGFGFGSPRTATMAGINGKVCEVVALLGRLRLADYEGVVAHRASLFRHYREGLPELQYQLEAPGVQVHQFVPALLPSRLRDSKAAVRAQLAERGIATGAYFSPHLMEQPYFQKTCVAGPLPVCDDISARMVSLPLYDTMTHDEVDYVVSNLRELLGEVRKPSSSEQRVSVV